MSIVNVYVQNMVRMNSLDEKTLESVTLSPDTASSIAEEPLWLELTSGINDLIKAGLKLVKALLVFFVALFWVLKALTQTFAPAVVQGWWCVLNLLKVFLIERNLLEREDVTPVPVVDQVLPAKLPTPAKIPSPLVTKLRSPSSSSSSRSPSSRSKTVSSPSSTGSKTVSFSVGRPERSPINI